MFADECRVVWGDWNDICRRDCAHGSFGEVFSFLVCPFLQWISFHTLSLCVFSIFHLSHLSYFLTHSPSQHFFFFSNNLFTVTPENSFASLPSHSCVFLQELKVCSGFGPSVSVCHSRQTTAATVV